MRWRVTAFILACLASGVAEADDDGRYARLHPGLNPVIRAPYRLGHSNAPQGGEVQVMLSLHEQRVANEYGREVAQIGDDPSLLAGRLGSLALLGVTGQPAVENLGVMLFSTTDQLPVVAGLNVVYSNVNSGRITRQAGVVAFDGHIHSGRSHDGGDSYEAILLAAQARGLDAIAITDHNEFDYARAADELKRLQAEGRMPPDFLLVPGEEITSVDGHILGYFLRYKVQPGMSAAETIRAIHAQGGIAVAPHPSGSGGVGLDNALELPFDGVEVMSGANVLPLGLLRDLEARDGQVGNRFKVSNSDAHASSGVGVMYTRIRVKERTLAGLRDGFRARRTEPVIENNSYHAYYRTLASPVGRTLYWPVLTYLDAKGRIMNAIARLFFLDRVDVLTSWEHVVFRMADVVFIPAEGARLARGVSELSKPLQMRSAAVTKGPLRLSYEQFDMLGFSLDDPMWKLEAKVDF